MRSIYLAADAQLSNTFFDFLLLAEKCLARYLQQIASVVSKLLDHADLRIGRRLEPGMLESAPAVPAAAMLYISEYLQDSLWIRRMVVAGFAVQPPDGLVFAHPFGRGQIARVETVEVGVVTIGIGKESQG